MTAPVLKHAFTSAKSDSADPTVIQPSHWNASHTITLSQKSLVGAPTSGTAVEITLDSTLDISGGGVLGLSAAINSELSALTAGVAASLPLAGGTMTGPVTLAADPTANLQPATKQYADALSRFVPQATGVRILASGTSITVSAVYVSFYAALPAVSLSDTINTGTSGIHGLSTGSFAAATWYYVWAAVKADGTKGAFIDPSPSAPTIPSGYIAATYLGAVRTATGSATLLGTIQIGKRTQYTSYQVLVGGSNSGVLTAASTANLIPVTARVGDYYLIGNNPGLGRAGAAPNSSYTYPSLPVLIGNAVASYALAQQFSFVMESTNVYYWSDNTYSNLYVMGWEETD